MGSSIIITCHKRKHTKNTCYLMIFCTWFLACLVSHVEGSNGRKDGGGDIRALVLSREPVSNHNSKPPKEEHQDDAHALASILIS